MDLLRVLSEATANAASITFDMGRAPMSSAIDSDNENLEASAAIQISKLIGPLESALVSTSEFSKDSAMMVRTFGGMGSLNYQQIASHLIRASLRVGPQLALDALKRFISTDSSTGLYVTALWGVSVHQRVNLLDDAWIIPLQELPDCEQKRWINDARFASHGGLVASILHFDRPTSVLVVQRKLDPLFVPAQQNSEHHDEYIQTNDLVKDITCALTLVGPRIVLPIVSWFIFEDPAIEQVASSFLGSGRSSPLLEILPSGPSNSPSLDAEFAREVTQLFLRTEGSTRNKLRVALDRLSQALRRRNLGDQAVELSTALETLVGDNQRYEMTHKVAVRSARLIGGTQTERERNASILKKMYGIRSAMVHTGSVDPHEKLSVMQAKISKAEILQEASSLCANVIVSILRQGSVPDWDTFDLT